MRTMYREGGPAGMAASCRPGALQPLRGLAAPMGPDPAPRRAVAGVLPDGEERRAACPAQALTLEVPTGEAVPLLDEPHRAPDRAASLTVPAEGSTHPIWAHLCGDSLRISSRGDEAVHDRVQLGSVHGPIVTDVTDGPATAGHSEQFR
jgi:hypothetical protein